MKKETITEKRQGISKKRSQENDERKRKETEMRAESCREGNLEDEQM